MRLHPMIVVRDVEASSTWYQTLLGATSGHGGSEFEMIMDEHTLLLSLHHRDFGEHPAMSDPEVGTPGAGVLLYVTVDDLDAAYARAKALGADLLDEPHENPLAGTIEFSLRDPDGYGISIAKRIGNW